ncbi:hypothetical protein [Archangium sp.]|uniref:hypothetical protein n=1 Tax=Archangium sp. TaxID=1872627 RepID=UPI002D261C78|nr:hypothetical protein [Archangium sp.]HYO60093.1 hypothetical protein [Archangium sp.]
MPYVLALEQGTTGSQVTIFDQQGRIKATAQREIYPRAKLYTNPVTGQEVSSMESPAPVQLA